MFTERLIIVVQVKALREILESGNIWLDFAGATRSRTRNPGQTTKTFARRYGSRCSFCAYVVMIPYQTLNHVSGTLCSSTISSLTKTCVLLSTLVRDTRKSEPGTQCLEPFGKLGQKNTMYVLDDRQNASGIYRIHKQQPYTDPQRTHKPSTIGPIYHTKESRVANTQNHCEAVENRHDLIVGQVASL